MLRVTGTSIVTQQFDVVIIGGGFYGCAIALYLAEKVDRVLVVESERELLKRASYVNQARLHNGYHYPRSFRTAASSFKNFGAFEELYQECIDTSFNALYAIARVSSKISGSYFERFCRQLQLPMKPARKSLARLFSPRLIEGVYECQEYAFDAGALRRILAERMQAAGISVQTGQRAMGIHSDVGTGVRVEFEDADSVIASWVFNCTYSALKDIDGQDLTNGPRLKHQVTEVCVVEVPEPIQNLGITVMDGPFFSSMPFPDRKLHSLTHVRYTPHYTWTGQEQPGLCPSEVLARHPKTSHFQWMLRDSQRYVPILSDTRLVDSLFEVKTLLMGTDVDDSRPIAFHRDNSNPRLVSILGGKLDNLFDVLEVIDRELELGK